MFMRRLDGSVNFIYRTWADYRNGFGQNGGDTEVWLGNDILHKITSDHVHTYDIRLEAVAFNGTSCGINATNLYMTNHIRKYEIRLGDYRCKSAAQNILVLKY